MSFRKHARELRSRSSCCANLCQEACFHETLAKWTLDSNNRKMLFAFDDLTTSRCHSFSCLSVGIVTFSQFWLSWIAQNQDSSVRLLFRQTGTTKIIRTVTRSWTSSVKSSFMLVTWLFTWGQSQAIIGLNAMFLFCVAPSKTLLLICTCWHTGKEMNSEFDNLRKLRVKISSVYWLVKRQQRWFVYNAWWMWRSISLDFSTCTRILSVIFWTEHEEHTVRVLTDASKKEWYNVHTSVSFDGKAKQGFSFAETQCKEQCNWNHKIATEAAWEKLARWMDLFFWLLNSGPTSSCSSVSRCSVIRCLNPARSCWFLNVKHRECFTPEISLQIQPAELTSPGKHDFLSNKCIHIQYLWTPKRDCKLRGNTSSASLSPLWESNTPYSAGCH